MQILLFAAAIMAAGSISAVTCPAYLNAKCEIASEAMESPTQSVFVSSGELEVVLEAGIVA